MKPISFNLAFLNKKNKDILALGAELKSSFCLIRGKKAYVYNLGFDLKNHAENELYKKAIVKTLKQHNLKPRIIVCDSHPDYLSTIYARELSRNLNIPHGTIQHHYAHIVACMAENAVKTKVLGVAIDGTGFGQDGKILGCEFLEVTYAGFKRRAYLENIALPGGDKAIIEPWRTGISYLYRVYKDKVFSLDLKIVKQNKANLRVITQMIDKNINSPRVSSGGRLFDAIAAILGMKMKVNFEAEAAIALENLATRAYNRKIKVAAYPYSIRLENSAYIISVLPMIKAIVRDLKKGADWPIIALKFHKTFAEIIFKTCAKIATPAKIYDIILSGGVFQNKLLDILLDDLFGKSRFKVHKHKMLKPTDMGISLGQAVCAYVSGDTGKNNKN